MADWESARAKIIEAIERFAEKTGPASTEGSLQPRYSSNILDLAEAAAWLTNEGQPHGGRTTITVGKS